MEHIFIPSKGRANTSQLLKYIKESGEDNTHLVIVVVEPQDYDAYANAYPKFNYMVLPKDNGGITYVRNYIKQHTESEGMDNYWQLDDDLTGLFYRQETRLVREGLNALVHSRVLFQAAGIALGGLEYRQFAWSATKPMVENSFCDSCVWVDNRRTWGMRYRDYVEGKEDRDFAMQVIKNGMKTGRTTLYAFSAPANGSNAGGLKETFYDVGKEEICVARMVEIWGTAICVPIVKEGGRNDVKIMWNEINSNQARLF